MSIPFAKQFCYNPDMNGEELRLRRKALGLSQEGLARKLDVTRQSVYMWESDKTGIPALLDLALRWLEHEHKEQDKEVISGSE